MKKVHALVLSGGGSRGAYEVGVIKGIVEVLGLSPSDPCPFQIFTGTSVGAINATYLASQAHRGDLGIDRLVDMWTGLRLGVHAKVAWSGWRPRVLLDVNAIEEVVRSGVDWHALRANSRSGKLRGLVIAALHVSTGKTMLFADTAPGVDFEPSRDPRREGRRSQITADHVLASAAIPGVFPPRRVGGELYYDGGLRFNTPIAPAIRMGATSLTVVSPLQESLGPGPTSLSPEGVPSLAFLAGKMVNALMLDAVVYDLQVLERFNGVIDVMQDVLTRDELLRVDESVRKLRGLPYRHLNTLVVAPSVDVGAVALRYLREHQGRLRREGLVGLVITAMLTPVSESTDLASYLLFDGGFATELIELGRLDSHARAEEIRATFA